MEELIALSDQMVADGHDPLVYRRRCPAGNATGWTATGWMEDIMLRTASACKPTIAWVTNEIAVQHSPEVVNAMEALRGSIQLATTTTLRAVPMPVASYLHSVMRQTACSHHAGPVA